MLQSLKKFHIHRIPVNDFLLEIAVIACEAWCTGPETEYRILNNRLTSSDAIEEICKMLNMLVVTFRR